MRCSRRFTLPEDLDGLELKPIFLEGSVANARLLLKHPTAFTQTILLDGKPIAIIGIVVLWRGVAAAWSLTSGQVSLAPMGFHHLVLEALEEAARELGLWRIQMNVLAKFPKNIKWAHVLGFTEEGRMLKFDSNKDDYVRLARIF